MGNAKVAMGSYGPAKKPLGIRTTDSSGITPVLPKCKWKENQALYLTIVKHENILQCVKPSLQNAVFKGWNESTLGMFHHVLGRYSAINYTCPTPVMLMGLHRWNRAEIMAHFEHITKTCFTTGRRWTAFSTTLTMVLSVLVIQCFYT